jgi:hypothetical protein
VLLTVLVRDLPDLVYRGIVLRCPRSDAQEISQQAQILMRENGMSQQFINEPGASYTIRAEQAPEEEMPDVKPPLCKGVRAFMIAAGAVLLALGVGLVLTIGGLMHADKVNSGQAAQIHALNQSNARMSGQLSVVAAALSGQNPADDTNLITCADLRKMGLSVTTGGSVSSVPGSVNLSQNAVRIPAHCPER